MLESTSTRASSIGLALFVSGAGVALSVVLGLYFWSFHWMLVVYGIAIVLVPLSAKLGGSARIDIVLGTILSIFLGGPLLGWQSPSVRAQTLSYISGLIPVHSYVLALDDESESVRLAACRSLIFQDYDVVRPRLMELVERPDLASRCLSVDNASSDNEETLRRLVIAEWSAEIRKPGGCDSVQAYADLIEYEGNSAGPRLLAAIVVAEPKVSDCIRGEFSRRYPGVLAQLEALGHPGRIETVIARPLFHDLIDATYTASRDVSLREFLNRPVIAQWGLSLGCSMVEREERPTEFVSKLSVTLGSQGCPISQVNSANLWSQACASATENPSDGLVTMNSLCRSIQREAVVIAMVSAAELVQGALVAHLGKGMESDIRVGEALVEISRKEDALSPDFDADGSLIYVSQDAAFDIGRLREDLRRSVQGDSDEGSKLARKIAKEGFLEKSGEFSADFERMYNEHFGEDEADGEDDGEDDDE